ncbi:MAG: four helix bundle protein [Chloroflexi bacterium]|nr:four helix bundle protein [Chloroflexota bacterium]
MTTNKEFGQQLEKRTKAFAVKMIQLASRLPKNREADSIARQMVRSGTSVGANYREANRAVSRADFKHIISICEKEASETQYWLEIITEVGWLSAAEFKGDLDECSQLLALFTSIHHSAKT